MKEYLKRTNAPASDPNFGANCFNQNLTYLTPAMLKDCHTFFDAAEDAVRVNPTYLARVKRERLVLESLELQREDLSNEIAQRQKSGSTPNVAAIAAVKDYEQRASDWSARALLAGMKFGNYNFPMDRYAPELITRGRPLLPKSPATRTSN
jgi:hypothetical protein